jgi:hypothetical protein
MGAFNTYLPTCYSNRGTTLDKNLPVYGGRHTILVDGRLAYQRKFGLIPSKAELKVIEMIWYPPLHEVANSISRRSRVSSQSRRDP